MAHKSIERFKQMAQMGQLTDDRRTDHNTKKCVEIGGMRQRFTADTRNATSNIVKLTPC